ncbi:hypothetical protein C8F04DRAFT_1093491 [Mycena alexandri]|uniref:Uncharacterized protein n=1 Tax=Mycena alexandri TaxID=1745969 RepID=A0AAD6T373_9AGAR|nr:hypothetical protein C8F04DRAFT_1093491 [Mycena alexandri]
MTVYLYTYYQEEWRQVNDFLTSLWQRVLTFWECTMWIRASTGRLSVDLVPSDIALDLNPLSIVVNHPQTATPLNVTEVMAIESLGLAHYHNIWGLYLSQFPNGSMSTATTVCVGAVTPWPSGHQYEEHVEIALPAEIDFDYSWWIQWEGDLMGNGWTRYRADDIFDTEITLSVAYHAFGDWLSQANYVFSRLQITSNLEDYVRIESIHFRLAIGNVRGNTPAGFLFLCPKEDFQVGPCSFRWPNRLAYWSLDPEGLQPLCTDEAERVGFPPFQLTTNIYGRSWDASVYAGLRQFHQAKGFDPDSQDIARNLGEPLYRLSRDVDPPFAHVGGFNEAEETAENTSTEDEWADAKSSLHESGCDEGSDAEDGVGEDSICVEQPGKLSQVHCLHVLTQASAPQVDEESMDSRYTDTGTNREANLEPQTANDPQTGGGFIHRIFGALRHNLVKEVDWDNIDTEPVSPFLV